MEIMTVCTGNICRSPLAEVVLDTRLADLNVEVHSAGVRGLPSAEMTPEAIELARAAGVDPARASEHRSRYLTEGMLSSPDLIIAMTRAHRRDLAELAPARLRSTFTAREFARLSVAISDDELAAAAAAAGANCSDRLRAVAAVVAGRRGLVPPPEDPADDDVIDPYRMPWETYLQSSDELLPALAEIERVVRLAATA